MTDTTKKPFKPTESSQYAEPKTKQPSLSELMAQYVKQCAVEEI